MVKIFLDPGHGGNDPGALGNGLREKDLTLQIAKRIEWFLISEYSNVTVKMSRTGDQTVSLRERTNAANQWGADYYLSIHINAGGGTGFESFVYSKSNTRNQSLQRDIHSEVIKQIDFRDRGMKEANFHVLRESKMPALLTENGFIDTIADANKLKNTAFIEKIARGHVNGLEKLLNLSRKTPVQEPVPSPPTNPDTGPSYYRVQIGAYANRKNAEEQAEKARQKNFSVYILQEGTPPLYKVQIGAFKNKKNADFLAQRAKDAGFSVYITNK